ncbi:MAG: hypothetical protein ACREK2_09430 [Gemmatimonadota bacterium]
MNPRFLVMIATSLVVFVGMIRLVLRGRASEFPIARVVLLGLVVVVGGMLYGYHGARSDWPWWVFYPPPMLLTVFAPPIVLGMRGGETALYLVLSFLSAPLIHATFALFLGWDEYMPFLPVPSLAEILA